MEKRQGEKELPNAQFTGKQIIVMSGENDSSKDNVTQGRAAVLPLLAYILKLLPFHFFSQ